jgi:hypothetical protein
MKIEHIALAGLGLYLLTRSASASTSPSTSDTGTGASTQEAVAQLPIQTVYSAAQLPEGVLRHGEDAITAEALPFQLRANALHDLKDKFNELMTHAISLQRQYGALETPIGAAYASGSTPTSLLALYDKLKAQYLAESMPITTWYAAEKKKIYATYTV